jgi:hypothetical protein
MAENTRPRAGDAGSVEGDFRKSSNAPEFTPASHQTKAAPAKLHAITGDEWVCANGIHNWCLHHGTPSQCRRIPDHQIATVRDFLIGCTKLAWTNPRHTPTTADLKHWIEAAAGQYISRGAVIVRKADRHQGGALR